MGINSIRNWAEEDRPREKIWKHGAEFLTATELIGILLNNGTSKMNAVETARILLRKVNNQLNNLCRLSASEILHLKIPGIGKAKAIAIETAFELGKRREQEIKRKEIIKTTEDVALYLKARLQYQEKEIFHVCYLNNGNRIVFEKSIGSGGIDATISDVRLILKYAVIHNATAFIACHNHPSGNLQPSGEDVIVTSQLIKAASQIKIRLLDHIIVSDEGYYSFRKEGILPENTSWIRPEVPVHRN